MVRNNFSRTIVFLFSFKKNQSSGEYTRLSYLIQCVGKLWVKEEKYFNLERNYFLLECVMILILPNYLNLSVISAAFGFPHTLFPVGLWYYTCLIDLLWRFVLSLLCLLFFLDFPQCLTLLSYPQVPVDLLFPWFLVVHSSRRPFAPSVSSWTRHSLWSFITNFSLSTVPSLESLWTGNAWHSRHAIGSWDARETHCRSLKVKMNCSLM